MIPNEEWLCATDGNIIVVQHISYEHKLSHLSIKSTPFIGHHMKFTQIAQLKPFKRLCVILESQDCLLKNDLLKNDYHFNA